MFRPYKVIIRSSNKTDPRAVLCFTALWDPKCLQGFVTECKVHTFVYMNLCDSWICLLGGPDDDLVRLKHVALTNILFYCILVKCCVID